MVQEDGMGAWMMGDARINEWMSERVDTGWKDGQMSDMSDELMID